MAENYTVHYFDVRGRAEPIRLILSYAKVDFKDQRIPYYDSATVIPPEIKAVATYGQIPLLEVNGKFLAQTVTICRYLARKFNLTGANDWDAARCDEIVDGAYDFLQLYTGAWDEKDPIKKKDIIDRATKTGREKYMSKFDAMLVANGGHFVGTHMTWADIIVANAVDFAEKLWQVQLTNDYPALQKLLATVFSANGIKEWIAKRPVTKL